MEIKNHIIDGRFKIISKIGEGSFGLVYKVLDLETKTKAALKFETVQTHLQLFNEIQAYSALSAIEGVPKIHCNGTYRNQQYFVMDLLGKSIDYYYGKQKKGFTLSCIISIGLQLLKRLENIHDHNYIHRDLKPANIVVGRKDNYFIYLIDFGLSKKYRDPVTKQHTIYREGRKVIGNYKYSSLNTRMGIEQSRRDDVEAFFYLLLKLLTGKLPWEAMDSDSGNVMNISFISIEEICRNVPEEFLDMLKYIRSIHFEERPNYNYIKGLLNALANKNNTVPKLDWIKPYPSSKIVKKSSKIQIVQEHRRKSHFNVINALIHDDKMPPISTRKPSDDLSIASISLSSNEHNESLSIINTLPEIPAFCRENTVKTFNYPEFLEKDKILKYTN